MSEYKEKVSGLCDPILNTILNYAVLNTHKGNSLCNCLQFLYCSDLLSWTRLWAPNRWSGWICLQVVECRPFCLYISFIILLFYANYNFNFNFFFLLNLKKITIYLLNFVKKSTLLTFNYGNKNQIASLNCTCMSLSSFNNIFIIIW